MQLLFAWFREPSCIRLREEKITLPICDSERSVGNLYGSPSPKPCHPLPKVKELYTNEIIVCMVPRTFVPQVDNLKERYPFAILND